MPKYWKYFLQSSVLQRADEYLIIINIINAGIIVSDGSYCKSFCRALFKKVKELDIYSQAETVLSCLVIFKRQWDIKDFGAQRKSRYNDYNLMDVDNASHARGTATGKLDHQI